MKFSESGGDRLFGKVESVSLRQAHNQNFFKAGEVT